MVFSFPVVWRSGGAWKERAVSSVMLVSVCKGLRRFPASQAAPLALSSSLPAGRQAASSSAPSAPPGGRKLRRTAGGAHGWAGKAAGREQAAACRARERRQRACGYPQRRRIPFVHRYLHPQRMPAGRRLAADHFFRIPGASRFCRFASKPKLSHEPPALRTLDLPTSFFPVKILRLLRPEMVSR